jgi:hypothetical protein
VNPFLSRDAQRLNVFGEMPEEPPCRDPGRRIEITPEIIAADEAARVAREQQRAGFSWRRPEPPPQPAWRRKSPRAQAARTPKLRRAAVSTPRPIAAMKHKPAAPAAPEKTKRMTKPRQQTKFQVLDAPVCLSEVPPQRNRRGRTSPYYSLYEQVKALPREKALPVTVENNDSGYAMATALRKLAKRENLVLHQRSSVDRTTFFFWLTPEQQEA